MPVFSPALMIVPLVMAALLCWLAREISRGSAPAQSVAVLSGGAGRHVDAGIDFVMIAFVALFIMFIDEHDVRSSQIFVYGLAGLSVVSILLVCVGRMLVTASASVMVRKIALRTILCLALFTVVLGMRAAGIGHTELSVDEIRLERHGG